MLSVSAREVIRAVRAAAERLQRQPQPPPGVPGLLRRLAAELQLEGATAGTPDASSGTRRPWNGAAAAAVPAAAVGAVGKSRQRNGDWIAAEGVISGGGAVATPRASGRRAAGPIGNGATGVPWPALVDSATTLHRWLALRRWTHGGGGTGLQALAMTSADEAVACMLVAAQHLQVTLSDVARESEWCGCSAHSCGR